MSRPRVTLAISLVLLSLAATACIIGGKRERQLRPGELDYKLGPFTYLEEGKLVGLAVGTQAALYREKEKYMPLAIGLANKDAATLRLSRESFVLQDENGRRYPVVPYAEFKESYGPQTMDRTLTTFIDIFISHFPNFSRSSSNFFPDRAGGGLIIDSIEVPRWYYVIDLLYFPRPESGVVGRRFELHVSSPGLPDEVFVKFQVKD